jgi:hypothetical protein
MRALDRAAAPPRPFVRPCFAEALEARLLLSGQFNVSDASVVEGNSGSSTLVFTIEWVGAPAFEMSSVLATTSDGTASAAEGDYVYANAFVTFQPFMPHTQTFSVQVNPDLREESSETVILTLSSPNNATIADGIGVGTIGADDHYPPTVQFISYHNGPNAREFAVEYVRFAFNEPVSGFDRSDLTLTRDGGPNLLTEAQTLSFAGDYTSFTIFPLSGLTEASGVYTLALSDNSGIQDFHSNPLAGGAFTTWTKVPFDADDQISEATPVGNGSHAGQVSSGDNVDMYRVVAYAGETGTFDLRATPGNFEPVLFTRLRLFDANGTELASDGAGFAHTFAAGGTYYVGVSEGGNAYDPVTGADTTSTRAGGKYALAVNIKPPVVPVRGEVRANTHTPNVQAFPATAMDDAGNFVVVWASMGQDSFATDGVYAQRYNAFGVAQGGEFRVNNTTAYNEYNPQVAMDAAGNFVVAWEGADASEHGIFARRYNAAGVAQGNEFLVNTVTANFQTNPTIAMDADGDYVIAWHSLNQVSQSPPSENDVYARRYTSTGPDPRGAFLVNTVTASQQRYPTAAMDDAGNFVIAWESANQDPGNSTGIYAQLYNAAGGTQGASFRVNDYVISDQNLPSAAMDADGDFVVTWQGYDPRDGNGVYAHRFNAAGLPLGGDIQVNTFETGFQRYTAIAMDARGNFVISWQNEFGDANRGETSVDAQRFTAAGAPVGVEFRVNSTTLGNHFHPAAAMDPDGDFVLAWASYGQDPGDNANASGVYFQRYAGERLAVTAAHFVYQTSPHHLKFGFNQNVSASIAEGDLSVVRLGAGGGPITVPYGFYDLNDDTLLVGFGTNILPDGNYRATLSGAGIHNASNQPLPADYVLDFFILTGDANRDRKVDFDDLAILAQGYNTAGKNFSQGNFSYDAAGAVDFDDLALLAQRYNTSLPPHAAAGAVAAPPAIAMTARPSPTAVPPPKRRPADAVFNTTAPVRRPAQPARPRR